MNYDSEQRLDYLEEQLEVLRMENRVLSTALKGIIKGLPQDIAGDVVEAIQFAFDNAVGELNYHEHPHADVFHDVTYDFFHEKE